MTQDLFYLSMQLVSVDSVNRVAVLSADIKSIDDQQGGSSLVSGAYVPWKIALVLDQVESSCVANRGHPSAVFQEQYIKSSSDSSISFR